MSRIDWSPQILAGIVHGLGGRVVENAPTFQFDLPLSAAKEVIPRLHKLGGIGVQKVGEWVTENPVKLNSPHTVVRLELHRRNSDKD